MVRSCAGSDRPASRSRSLLKESRVDQEHPTRSSLSRSAFTSRTHGASCDATNKLRQRREYRLYPWNPVTASSPGKNAPAPPSRAPLWLARYYQSFWTPASLRTERIWHVSWVSAGRGSPRSSTGSDKWNSRLKLTPLGPDESLVIAGLPQPEFARKSMPVSGQCAKHPDKMRR